jgi:hypothetical protein
MMYEKRTLLVVLMCFEECQPQWTMNINLWLPLQSCKIPAGRALYAVCRVSKLIGS